MYVVSAEPPFKGYGPAKSTGLQACKGDYKRTTSATISGRWSRSVLTVWNTSTTPSVFSRSRRMLTAMNVPVRPHPSLKHCKRAFLALMPHKVRVNSPAVDQDGSVFVTALPLLHLSDKIDEPGAIVRCSAVLFWPFLELELPHLQGRLILCMHGETRAKKPRS